MTAIAGIFIPSDSAEPVRLVGHDNTDYKDLAALIFDGDRDGGLIECLSSEDSDGNDVSLWGDEEALLKEGAHTRINARAMQLYAALEGVGINDFASPLVGNFVVLGGVDGDGNTLSAPISVARFDYTWKVKLIDS